VDDRTISAYDAAAADYAEEWEDSQPPPTDLYALITKYFPVGRVADIGCGSGRDSAWLGDHGFDVVGYDASDGLLAEARRRHPGIRFERAVLPKLDAIASGSFSAVLCETVVMHLPKEAIGAAVERLIDILAPGGTLYLSWRVTDGDDIRDPAGRLYAAFDADAVTAALPLDAVVLLNEERTSESSGRTIHRLILRTAEPKTGATA
jgi:SAM-dependent methyltransferase